MWGHNFYGPIPVDQVLTQEAPHNEFLVENRLKNLVSMNLDGWLHGP